MKKLLTKCISLVFVMLIALFLSGCQSLFIPRNVPVVLQEGVPSKSQSTPKITIDSYRILCPGIVQDITSNGNSLIVLNDKNSKAPFSIDFYNTDTQELSPFISSEKRDLTALFDTSDTGIYYVEKMNDPLSGKSGSQLLWADINKDSTRIISLPEENVVKYFGIGESDQVVYINNNNNIVIADNQGDRQVYSTFRNYNILSVDFMKENNAVAFIAYDPANEEKTNLYYAEIKTGTLELIPNLLAENVTNFDVNDINNQIIFVENAMNNQNISIWTAETATSKIVATGNFGTGSFTPNGEKIIFTKYSPSFNSQYQSIWIMNSDGENPLQITAPLKLNSRVMCHPFKPNLYFSVEKNAADIISGNDSILSQTYQVNYTIE
ncbi:hypothetical protein [Acetobacterium bakii]|nr:hypothetical protein [Acetobacterium bakii]